MNILLIGAPGSGKGTQAKKLTDEKKFHHLSTGDIFRYNLKEKTELGLLAQSYMDKGDLVPDGVTINMVKEALSKKSPKDTIVFDGFPRNQVQAEALDAFLKDKKMRLDLVIYLKVSDEKIVDRLTGRLWAPQSGRIYHIKNNPPKAEGRCDETGEALITREDDKKSVVLARLKVFWENTSPLLEYYQNQGNLKEMDGESLPEDISEQIFSLIEKCD